MAQVRLAPTMLVPPGNPFTPDGAFQFQFVAEPGMTHQVQYSMHFQPSTDLASFDSTAEPVTILDAGAVGNVRRFYRAVTP